MKETIDIIRHRRREVAILLGLGIVSEIFNLLSAWARLLMPKSGAWSSLIMVSYAIYIMIVVVIALTYCGFFRSIAINPFETKTVGSLLSMGKPFFWRLFVVQVLFVALLIAVSYVLVLLLKIVLLPAIYRPDSFAHAVWWARGPSYMAAYALLALPYVLAAALILVRDCSQGQSLRGIFSIRLAGSNLVMLTVSAAVLNSLWSFVPGEAAAEITFRIIHIPYRILVGLLNIFVGIVAVRMLVAQFGWSQRPSKAH